MLNLKLKEGGRVFPESDKSSDILKGLLCGLNESNVKVMINSKVTDIISENNIIKSVIINNEKVIEGDYYIIATGGASYPLTGSRGEGQKFAEKLGHKIVPLKQSLVPIEIKEPWIKELMGLSLKNVTVEIKSKNKCLYKEMGEMLFTHFGLSGPLILSGSRYIEENKEYNIIIDLKPALDEGELDKRIQKDFQKYINKDFKNALDDLLPKKIIPIIISLSNINELKKVHDITREERKNLVRLIKNFNLTVKGLRSLNEAIVTAGGVDTKEIDPSTMKSKIINNLSFAGEVIDVDAYTGGYNVQIALSTGYVAGNNI